MKTGCGSTFNSSSLVIPSVVEESLRIMGSVLFKAKNRPHDTNLFIIDNFLDGKVISRTDPVERYLIKENHRGDFSHHSMYWERVDLK